MVRCIFWTPTGSVSEDVLPQTRELARRVASWDFVRQVIWLGQAPGWWEFEVSPAVWTDRSGWLRALQEASQGEEHVFLVPADAPLLREDLCRTLVETHRERRADYTFADCYPLGLAGEAVSTFALQGIAALNQGPVLPDRQGLFTCLIHHVNHFDVETLLSPIDLRTHRVTFFDDHPRNRLLVERFWERRTLPIRDFLEEVRRDRVSQRTLPAFWKMQWTDRQVQLPAYRQPSLVPSQGRAMALEDLCRVVDRVGRWTGPAVLMPGFWGEVSQYPWVGQAVRAAAAAGFRLVVETSGLGWSEDVVRDLVDSGADLTWIVELDALDAPTYARLRGDGFEEALAFAETLRDRFPGRVYLQTVRCDLTEDHVESFFSGAKERGFQPLVVGYDDLAGRLPPRATVDLSPWRRHPCWHLQRGLHSLADGRVVSCHQYPGGEVVWGNLLTEDPAVVWERGNAWMLAHQNEDYPPECRSCHEYFQYVF